MSDVLTELRSHNDNCRKDTEECFMCQAFEEIDHLLVACIEAKDVDEAIHLVGVLKNQNVQIAAECLRLETKLAEADKRAALLARKDVEGHGLAMMGDESPPA